MLARAAIVLAGAFGLAVAVTAAPRPPTFPLHERMAQLAASECTTDTICEMRAVQLGLDPVLIEMPDDALRAACFANDRPACAYLEALHRANCAGDMQHDDCAVFRDETE
jgi:hypothetical protein